MPPRIDLRPDHLEIVCKILREHVPDRGVLAFGSRATWTAKEYSDLDLAVLGDEPLTLDITSALTEEFSESDLPFKVDIVEWAWVDENFRDKLRRNGVVVQTSVWKAEKNYVTKSTKRLERESKLDHLALINIESRSDGDEWPRMIFSEAVQINPKTHLERGSIYPFVEMASVNSNSRCVYAEVEREYTGGGTRFRDGDTLMARITPCLENGKIARYCSADKIGVAHGSTEFIVIRGRTSITESEFSYYLTRSKSVHQFAISQMTGTSGRQRVSTKALDHLEVPIPPVAEQRAIARILGTLDEKIELNRRMNKTLEEMAQALFKSWFVDFDPVRAKMEGRDTGLPKHIDDLFSDRLMDSELGEIPYGWQTVSLSEIIDLNPKRTLRKGQVAPYLDMAGMPTKGHIPQKWTDRPYGSGMRFTNGDTLLARITPCLENGKTAYVDFLPSGNIGWGSTEYIVMRPKPWIPNEYAYCLARSPDFREFAIHTMTGTSGRQRVPAKALAYFPLAVPSKDVVEAFGRLIRPLFAQASENARESRALITLRDTLLPELITGQIRLRKAETMTEVVS